MLPLLCHRLALLESRAIASVFARRLRGRSFASCRLRLPARRRELRCRGTTRLFDFLAHRRLATRLDDRIGDRLGHQLHGANRVVVARDWNRDQIRIGVRIDERDDRDAQLIGLVHRDPLLLGVDHEHETGKTRKVLDSGKVLRKLVALTAHHQLLFLGVVLEITAGLASRLELLETANLLLHRLEVRQQSAQPPLRHVHRSATLGLALHDVDELPLGADEEDVVAAEDHFPRELLRQLQLPQRLLQVDDVNAVSLREDETTHLRVPTAGLVSEVDTGFEELLQVWLSH